MMSSVSTIQSQTLAEIDAILAQTQALPNGYSPNNLSKGHSNIALIRSAIERLTPLSSSYRQSLTQLLNQANLADFSAVFEISHALTGQLQALRQDYANGYINTVESLLNAELFGDFMEMAGHLLEQDYYLPAAVIIGSVLEENLRKLCLSHQIQITNNDGKPLTAGPLNQALKDKAYNNVVFKSVDHWLAIRNKAAHGETDQFTKEQVDLMYAGVLGFLRDHAV